MCPDCGGELLLRPRRQALGIEEDDTQPKNTAVPTWLVWAVSSGVWSLITLAGTLSIFKLYRATDSPMRFTTTLCWESCQVLTYIPLTPFAFAFASRFPIRRHNWKKLSLLYLAFGVLFSVAHLALRGITPYAYWDSPRREFASAIWDTHAHVFRIPWPILQKQFLSGVVDDVTGVFLPIALVAHAVSYYQRFRERERRASQLEGQLAKAHLQALKSQLQPHFLFNTMHSISALMLIDVKAADRMMTRLGDLLRMSLESAGKQITTLKGELEFLNCYLEIEKVRFGERLDVTMNIAPEALDAAVPHLLLQPLVDNSVKHGISKIPAGGKIRIGVTVNNGELHMEIRDNGPGVGPEVGRVEGLGPTGLGLRITRERLESLYGKHQSVQLASVAGGGTITRICIPFRVQQGHGDVSNERNRSENAILGLTITEPDKPN